MKRHQTLRFRYGARSTGNICKESDAVREATRHCYPTADINDMLTEIESGYGTPDRR
jgi:hypothetical protein